MKRQKRRAITRSSSTKGSPCHPQATVSSWRWDSGGYTTWSSRCCCWSRSPGKVCCRPCTVRPCRAAGSLVPLWRFPRTSSTRPPTCSLTVVENIFYFSPEHEKHVHVFSFPTVRSALRQVPPAEYDILRVVAHVFFHFPLPGRRMDKIPRPGIMSCGSSSRSSFISRSPDGAGDTSSGRLWCPVGHRGLCFQRKMAMNVPLQLATQICAPMVEVPRRRGPKHGVAGAGLHVHVLLMAELHTAPTSTWYSPTLSHKILLMKLRSTTCSASLIYVTCTVIQSKFCTLTHYTANVLTRVPLPKCEVLKMCF